MNKSFLSLILIILFVYPYCIFGQTLPDGKYPTTSKQLLNQNDLKGKSTEELKIMRNEIFARHGYIFKTEDMKTYFSKQSWYKPQYNDVTPMLSDIEKKNGLLIKSCESETQISNEIVPNTVESVIKNECKKIDGAKLVMKKITNKDMYGVDYDCGETNLTYFIYNSDIQKIIEEHASGDYEGGSIYYYKNGKLICIEESGHGEYEDPNHGIYENITYVNNDEAIKYTENNKTKPCKICKFNSSSKAYKLFQAYTTKKFKDAL